MTDEWGDRVTVQRLWKLYGQSPREAERVIAKGGDRAEVLAVLAAKEGATGAAAGAEIALADLSLAIEPGEVIVLLGRRGSGKSTLLRLLNGLETPTAGFMSVGNVTLEGLTPRALGALRRERLGTVFPTERALLPHLTVLRNVELILEVGGMARGGRRAGAMAALERFGITGLASRRPKELTLADQVRTAFARAFVRGPRLVLVDDPFTAIPALERADLVDELVREARAEGTTLLLAIRDAEDAVRVADRIVVLKRGVLAGVGAPQALLEQLDEEGADDELQFFLRRLAEQRAMRLRAERLDGVIRGFEGTISEALGSVGRSAGALDGTARTLMGIARETGEQVIETEASLGQTAASVGVMGDAAHQMSGLMEEIGQHVGKSVAFATAAAAQAQQTDDTMRSLTGAARSIVGVVEMISAIAARTRLLALNATIESARAGESGKGFAVVASEVKQLSEQTSHATEEISIQATAIQTTIDQAVSAIGGIKETITNMSALSAAVAGVVERQRASVSDIAQRIAEVSATAEALLDTIRRFGNGAERTDAATGHVMQAAGGLISLTERLRDGVDRFLTEIREGEGQRASDTSRWQ